MFLDSRQQLKLYRCIYILYKASILPVSSTGCSTCCHQHQNTKCFTTVPSTLPKAPPHPTIRKSPDLWVSTSQTCIYYHDLTQRNSRETLLVVCTEKRQTEAMERCLDDFELSTWQVRTLTANTDFFFAYPMTVNTWPSCPS